MVGTKIQSLNLTKILHKNEEMGFDKNKILQDFSLWRDLMTAVQHLFQSLQLVPIGTYLSCYQTESPTQESFPSGVIVGFVKCAKILGGTFLVPGTNLGSSGMGRFLCLSDCGCRHKYQGLKSCLCAMANY